MSTPIKFVVGQEYTFTSGIKATLRFISPPSGEMAFETKMGTVFAANSVGTVIGAGDHAAIGCVVPPKMVRYAIMNRDSALGFYPTLEAAKKYAIDYGHGIRIVKLVEDTNQ